MTNGVTALSTTDSGPSQGCVKSGLGVPWFWASCCVLCATYKGMYWTDEPHPPGALHRDHHRQGHLRQPPA